MNEFIVSSKSNSSFKPVPEGIHPARCCAMVITGRRKTKYGVKNTCWIGFELASHRIQWEKNGFQVDIPSTVWRNYNFTLREDSSLRKDLQSWRGRPFTQEELDGFDLRSVVGKPCMVEVTHYPKGDKVYANIGSLNRVTEGTFVPKLEGDTVIHSPTHKGDIYLLPEWIQKILKEPEVPKSAPAPARKAVPVELYQAASDEPDARTDDEPDDIPASSVNAGDFNDDDTPF